MVHGVWNAIHSIWYMVYCRLYMVYARGSRYSAILEFGLKTMYGVLFRGLIPEWHYMDPLGRDASRNR